MSTNAEDRNDATGSMVIIAVMTTTTRVIPAHEAAKHADISRGLCHTEFQQVLVWAKQAGLRSLL